MRLRHHTSTRNSRNFFEHILYSVDRVCMGYVFFPVSLWHKRIAYQWIQWNLYRSVNNNTGSNKSRWTWPLQSTFEGGKKGMFDVLSFIGFSWKCQVLFQQFQECILKLTIKILCVQFQEKNVKEPVFFSFALFWVPLHSNRSKLYYFKVNEIKKRQRIYDAA